jgi:hypothetical protein
MSEVLGLTAQAGMGSDLRPSCTPESSATEGLSSYESSLKSEDFYLGFILLILFIDVNFL